MALRIQLITFTGCPNAAAARAVVRRTLSEAGIAATIEEIDTQDPSTPELLREWGSPTVLVNGDDIAGLQAPTGPSCRLYRDAQGRSLGALPEVLFSAALTRAIESEL